MLSHGQAVIQHGLAKKKEILSCKIGEDTLKLFRTVHDGVRHMESKIHDIPFSKELLKSCKEFLQRYSSFLGDQQKKPKKKVKLKEIGKNLLSKLKEFQKKARVRGISIVRQGR